VCEEDFVSRTLSVLILFTGNCKTLQCYR